MRLALVPLLAAGALALAACNGSDTTAGAPAADTPAPGAPASDAAPAATPAAANDGPSGPSADADGFTRACMIAGEFELMGRTIRSRDCVQADTGLDAATHRQLCEGLAQTSAQLGQGKAGTVEYMARCPTPAQGSCQGLFGQSAVTAFYYERDDDDLAALPDSCRLGGGTWTASPG